MRLSHPKIKKIYEESFRVNQLLKSVTRPKFELQPHVAVNQDTFFRKGCTTQRLLDLSYIRHKDFCSFVRPDFSVTLVLPPLDSEMGWTGELWSKTKFQILEN